MKTVQGVSKVMIVEGRGVDGVRLYTKTPRGGHGLMATARTKQEQHPLDLASELLGLDPKTVVRLDSVLKKRSK